MYKKYITEKCHLQPRQMSPGILPGIPWVFHVWVHSVASCFSSCQLLVKLKEVEQRAPLKFTTLMTNLHLQLSAAIQNRSLIQYTNATVLSSASASRVSPQRTCRLIDKWCSYRTSVELKFKCFSNPASFLVLYKYEWVLGRHFNAFIHKFKVCSLRRINSHHKRITYGTNQSIWVQVCISQFVRYCSFTYCHKRSACYSQLVTLESHTWVVNGIMLNFALFTVLHSILKSRDEMFLFSQSDPKSSTTFKSSSATRMRGGDFFLRLWMKE